MLERTVTKMPIDIIDKIKDDLRLVSQEKSLATAEAKTDVIDNLLAERDLATRELRTFINNGKQLIKEANQLNLTKDGTSFSEHEEPSSLIERAQDIVKQKLAINARIEEQKKMVSALSQEKNHIESINVKIIGTFLVVLVLGALILIL